MLWCEPCNRIQRFRRSLADEAGRGPVLGPMVYAAAFCEASDEAAMRDMCAILTHHASRCRPIHCTSGVLAHSLFGLCRAFADSKTLNDEQREGLFVSVRGDDRLGYAIESVSAAHISAHMLRRCGFNNCLHSLHCMHCIMSTTSTKDLQQSECCQCRDRISLNQIANECTFNLIAAVLDMGYCLSQVMPGGSARGVIRCSCSTLAS